MGENRIYGPRVGRGQITGAPNASSPLKPVWALVYSLRLTWARLGFRVNSTRSGVAGALGEEVVSQRLSTEIWGPGRCTWLLNPSPAPKS